MPQLPAEQQRLYERIYLVVRQIPPGKVATYGQVAQITGNCTARMVGYAMAACPDDVPWQRVINAQGKVSFNVPIGAGTAGATIYVQMVSLDANGPQGLAASRGFTVKVCQ